MKREREREEERERAQQMGEYAREHFFPPPQCLFLILIIKLTMIMMMQGYNIDLSIDKVLIFAHQN